MIEFEGNLDVPFTSSDWVRRCGVAANDNRRDLSGSISPSCMQQRLDAESVVALAAVPSRGRGTCIDVYAFAFVLDRQLNPITAWNRHATVDRRAVELYEAKNNRRGQIYFLSLAAFDSCIDLKMYSRLTSHLALTAQGERQVP
jgi:hypothetical protein